MEIPERFKKYFDAAGVIYTPEEQSTGNKVVLSREYFLELYLRKEEFFDAVPLFKPLRNSTLNALQKLAKKGIIDGNKVGKGCKSCKQKALVSVLLQLLKHTQTIIMQYRAKDKLKELGDQLRKFINKPEATLIVVLKNANSIERIEF